MIAFILFYRSTRHPSKNGASRTDRYGEWLFAKGNDAIRQNRANAALQLQMEIILYILEPVLEAILQVPHDGKNNQRE